MRPRALAVLVLVVSAGCVSIQYAPGGTDSRTAPANATVTVTHVVDGDTVDVRYPSGSTDRVRLLGIDTPETHVDNTPTEYEGVPDTEGGRACLRDAGENASRWLTERVEGEQVTLVFDPMADQRGDYDRLLAYVYQNGTDLDYRLVADGRARVYESSFTHLDEYHAAEDRAQADGRGLWHCAS